MRLPLSDCVLQLSENKNKSFCPETGDSTFSISSQTINDGKFHMNYFVANFGNRFGIFILIWSNGIDAGFI